MVAVLVAGLVFVLDQFAGEPEPSASLMALEPTVPAPAAPATTPVLTPEATTAPPSTSATSTAPSSTAPPATKKSAAPPAAAPKKSTAPRAPAPAGGVDHPTRASAGLPWRSGIVVGPPSEVAAWAEFRGRPVDVIHAFAARGSWEDLETAGWVLGYYADHPAALVISQPFWPEDSGGSLDACASGAYDSHWNNYGSALKAAGRTDAYTRLAWEFNGDWFEWSATDVGAWKQCFTRVVKAVRATAPGARFEWNMNAHGSQTSDGDAWASYPGDDVVDVVGIDPYDHYPSSSTAAEFDEQCQGSEGLCTVMSFAREHGKKVGVTEWGVAGGGGGGGDNPLYIQKMFETFMANKDVMGYETYFNSADYGNALDSPRQNPKSADKYRELFGG